MVDWCFAIALGSVKIVCLGFHIFDSESGYVCDATDQAHAGGLKYSCVDLVGSYRRTALEDISHKKKCLSNA
jgi:hypothetical protein